MQLQTIVTPAKPAVAERIVYTGQAGGIAVEAGKTLTIESSPGGEDILSVEVPTGKRWIVYIKVDIQESDV